MPASWYAPSGEALRGSLWIDDPELISVEPSEETVATPLVSVVSILEVIERRAKLSIEEAVWATVTPVPPGSNRRKIVLKDSDGNTAEVGLLKGARAPTQHESVLVFGLWMPTVADASATDGQLYLFPEGCFYPCAGAAEAPSSSRGMSRQVRSVCAVQGFNG